MTNSGYSRKGGDSIYPIRPGVIVRLDIPRCRYNKRLKTKLDHDVYLWFQRMGSQKGVQPKKRKWTVGVFYVPRIAGGKNKTLVIRKLMLKETLIIYLSKGYTLICEGVNFNYTDATWALAYQKIGLV